MQPDARIKYRLDVNGRIVGVNDEWDRFAHQNSGDEVLWAKVMHRPIEDFIDDPETREFYSRTIDQVRNGNMSIFQFRCDSPDRCRLLEMRVELTVDGLVEFTSRPIWIEERRPELLFDASAPRTSTMLRVCSWCKKIFVNGAWIEVDETRLFDGPEKPSLTHGVCDDCNAKLRKNLASQPPVITS